MQCVQAAAGVCTVQGPVEQQLMPDAQRQYLAKQNDHTRRLRCDIYVPLLFDAGGPLPDRARLTSIVADQ